MQIAMNPERKGEIAIFGFYGISIALGFLIGRPKLAFYLSVFLGIATCALLFHLKIYVEMLGVFHAVPFAFVPWAISHYRL
jgi:hypothetical protein